MVARIKIFFIHYINVFRYTCRICDIGRVATRYERCSWRHTASENWIRDPWHLERYLFLLSIEQRQFESIVIRNAVFCLKFDIGSPTVEGLRKLRARADATEPGKKYAYEINVSPRKWSSVVLKTKFRDINFDTSIKYFCI